MALDAVPPQAAPNPGREKAPGLAAAPGHGMALFYGLTLAAVAGALVVEFLVAYRLLVDHPTHAPGLIKETYGALALALVVLAAQATLVFAGLFRPLRENALELARLKAALDQHSHYDELTKVLNRLAYDQMVVRELEGLKRYGAVFSGILVDIDGFRSVNESLGYDAGDQVLYELAQLLKQHMRKADCIFRWRSGRFLILASGIDAAQAARFAGKLRDLVAGHRFREVVSLSVSMGVGQAEPSDTPEIFIGRVKTALALAKDKGRGAVAAAGPAPEA